MKIALITIAFCAIITTGTAQNITTQPLPTHNKDHSMGPKSYIVKNILSFKESTIFYQSVNAGGLVQTFDNPGPLTVFLPADSAFDKMPEGKLDTLLASTRKLDLIAMITYHVVPGKISFKNITKEVNKGKGQAVFRTLSGAPLRAQFDGKGNIELIDETGGRSTIQKKDMKQQNGLIHLVSAVLMPKLKKI